MNLVTFPTGAYEENCTILWNKNNKALVFDPGFDAPAILKTLKDNELEITAYICTHAHADHINALAEVHKKHPAPVAMHSKDLEWAFESFNQIPPPLSHSPATLYRRFSSTGNLR